MKDMEIIEDCDFDINTKKRFKEDDITDLAEPKKGFIKWLSGLFVSDKKIGELNGTGSNPRPVSEIMQLTKKRQGCQMKYYLQSFMLGAVPYNYCFTTFANKYF